MTLPFSLPSLSLCAGEIDGGVLLKTKEDRKQMVQQTDVGYMSMSVAIFIFMLYHTHAQNMQI